MSLGPCIGSTESYSMDHQGSLPSWYFCLLISILKIFYNEIPPHIHSDDYYLKNKNHKILITSVSKDVVKLNLNHCWLECEMVQLLKKMNGQYLIKYTQSYLMTKQFHLGVWPQNCARVQQEVYTRILMAIINYLQLL